MSSIDPTAVGTGIAALLVALGAALKLKPKRVVNNYVTKELFNAEITNIKETLKELNEKQDKVYNYIYDLCKSKL